MNDTTSSYKIMNSKKNISRRDNSSVKASTQVRSVPEGTAGVTATDMFYRYSVPNGTLRKNQDINYMTMLKIIPKSKQPLSRRDKISVDYPDPNRSVPEGTAGVTVTDMFYRSGVPDGTIRKVRDINGYDNAG